MTKTIVIDAREFSSSSGRYVRNYLATLEKLDTPYKFIVLLHESDAKLYKPHNPAFMVQTVPYKKFTFSEQFAFNKFLRSLNPDLVHFAFAQQPILYRKPKVTAILDLTAYRFNLAFGPARLVAPFRRAIYRFVVRSAAKRSTHIITLSKFVKEDLVKEFGAAANKITVTYCAADSITDRAVPYAALKKKPYLLYVGRVQAHKNIKKLVDAHQTLLASYPDLQLVVAGKKDLAYEDLEAYIARTSAQNVILTGFVSDGTLRWLYEHCKAYVFPSLSEGFGLPGLEAMLHGAPVASSNATCLPEIHGQAALYFNPNNTEDIAQKIDRLLSDQPFREELISRGRAKAKEYSWKQLTERTLEVYKKVLGD